MRNLSNTFAFVLMVVVLALASGVVFGQDDCSQPVSDTIPSGARRITVDYQDGNPGWWWEIYNWKDGNLDGEIDSGDDFNFRDNRIGTFECPGPSIMKLSDAGETWYYLIGVTGSTGSLENFNIFRTKDFAHFELHMRVFSDADINGVNQSTNNGILSINNTWFSNLQEPSLYFDPTHTAGPNRRIYISFTACKESTNSWDDASVFLVQMNESDFLSWHAIPDPQNPSRDGPRFADFREGLGFQQWYFYNSTNYSGAPYTQDGGHSVDGLIPASGDPSVLAGPVCGELESREKGWSFRCVGAAPFMERDSYVFFDPKLANSHPWKRVLFYVWSDKHASTQWYQWGNRIAAHPLRANNIQFDVNYDLIPVAYSTNTNNKISVDGNLTNNGSREAKMYQRPHGGIAEAPAVLYLPETDRYYVFYCRNVWDSGTYQIVYRMTAAGAPLSSLEMGWTDANVVEHVLLRNVKTDAGGVPLGDGQGGWKPYEYVTITHNEITYKPRMKSFGTPELFSLTSGAGFTYYYIATAVKMDYKDTSNGREPSGERTVFIKELTVNNQATGVLKQLAFDPTDTIDPSQNIVKFQIPFCRKQGS